MYLVTDLALGGELFDRICRKGSYYETDAADLIRATLSAVAYLHDHGIVHRDLKPENLLFRTPEDNADLLIADFGLSRIMDEEAFRVLTTTCGTPGYMAPEIFKKSGHGKPVCAKATLPYLNEPRTKLPLEMSGPLASSPTSSFAAIRHSIATQTLKRCKPSSSPTIHSPRSNIGAASPLQPAISSIAASPSIPARA